MRDRIRARLREYRLKRLADFISSVASNAVAQIVTKLATAWATS
jgi:hypothetical protein